MPKAAPSITSTLASLSPHSSTPLLRIHFPPTCTTVSSPGVQLTKEAAAPIPMYSVSARALSHLSFSNCDLSPASSTSTENSLASAPQPQPQQGTTEEEPQQQRRGSRISLHSDPDQERQHGVPKYMVISLDLDAPFPSVPLMSPLLHGLQADLTLATEDIDPEDEYIPLEATSVGGGDAGLGQVVDYMGPSPPPKSAPHRYMFMLWEQPRGLTREKICEEIGIVGDDDDEGGDLHGDLGIMGRSRWDQEGFERRLGLERVVGGNYFVC